ncbi:YniB family protein [Proteus mirabilis]|nr:YniB family protein [Proteus mirabilis]MBG3007449.1 YniB family protein [Proteus mirabilis]MBG3082264.1 YniB family protein [Proteus mirabilis]MBG3085784.1 YniB family protein [Proteus mirabilis]MBG5947141.1 YniB family protein [Proteus mirabilis]
MSEDKMSYQHAGIYAIVKRVIGWLIFIPAFISTTVSLIELAAIPRENGEGVNAVINDFFRVLAEMVQFNTPWLDFFWRHSPVPNTQIGFSQQNIIFFVIFFLMFIGLALSASGLRMYRQVKYLKENIQDQLIIERALKSGITAQELEQNIKLPRHTLFTQVMVLYISPIIVIAIGYFLLKFLGW